MTKSKPTKSLDYLKMLKAIEKLVDNDWCSDMEVKILEGQKQYTQEEAKKMAETLGKVYSISHCLYCLPCRTRFELK